MIWGSQYDAMMNFMKRRGKESAITSTNNDSIQNNSYETGTKETDVILNVFDLYGCHYEYTLEASSIWYRIFRGGSPVDSNSPSCRGNFFPHLRDDNHSSRLTLFIK